MTILGEDFTNTKNTFKIIPSEMEQRQHIFEVCFIIIIIINIFNIAKRFSPRLQ